MDEDSQPTNPTRPIVDLKKDNQEGEFHTSILGEGQVNMEGGVDVTIGDDEPFQGEFDVMLAVVSLYTDMPCFDHNMDPTENVDKETQINDTANMILPPLVANADNGKEPEMYDTLGTVANPSQEKESKVSNTSRIDTPIPVVDPHAVLPMIPPMLLLI